MTNDTASAAQLPLLPDTTFVIKTFNRPHCLARLLESLEQFGPVPTVIVDDGKPYADSQLTFGSHVKYIKTEFDIGLSAGRNTAIANLDTSRFILLDDDFVIGEQHPFTQEMYRAFEELDLDILTFGFARAKNMWYWARDFICRADSLHLKWPRRPREHWVQPCDLGLNCFLGKTSKVDEVRWDRTLKVREHWDFFLRMKFRRGKVACWMKPGDFVRQQNVANTHEYRKYRGRSYFAARARRKHGFKVVFDHVTNSRV